MLIDTHNITHSWKLDIVTKREQGYKQTMKLTGLSARFSLNRLAPVEEYQQKDSEAYI